MFTEDGHCGTEAQVAGLCGKEDLRMTIFGKSGVDLFWRNPLLLHLNDDIAIDQKVVGDCLSRRFTITVSQLIPDAVQILRVRHTEEEQKQSGEHFNFKPDSSGSLSQSCIDPLFVFAQKNVDQEKSCACAGTDGLSYDPFPLLRNAAFCVVQLVVLVRTGFAIVALNENLGLVDDRHGHVDLTPCLVHGKVFVAGNVPLLRIFPLKAIVAVPVHVQLLAVLPDAHLLPVKLQEEAITLGGIRGQKGVAVAVKYCSILADRI